VSATQDRGADTPLDAWKDVERASHAADVDIQPATPAEVALVQDVIGAVWGPAQRLQANLLLAMAHAGATVAAAVRDGVAVGACVGFLGWADVIHLHSHMVAVLPGAQARGVGYALKLWQRAACMEHGVDEIRWTYDPLVRRNAYFNLAKLGARVIDYRPDFYGEMDDIINAGDRSDRFEVSWALSSPGVVDALAGLTPVPRPEARLVAIPDDYELLRRADPGAAREFREQIRATIADHWREGLRPMWSADGGYAFQAVEE
jgi:predicted GNAT superfamily acetyltransferase